MYLTFYALLTIISKHKYISFLILDEEKVDILINNAGIMWGERELTQEGIESQLGVNHMGHFLLTNLLIDKLKVFLSKSSFSYTKF